MVLCIWNTSPNRTLQLLQSLPNQALLSGNPSSDHLWMMHSSAFYTFIYTDMSMCTHPEEKLLPSQQFVHSAILLSSFLNDFLHAMAFSEEPCPVVLWWRMSKTELPEV